MNNRIVIWGENETEQKVLITLELLDRDNKVEICVIPHEMATEEFYQLLMDDWKGGKDVEFPKDVKKIEKPLSMTDSLLPDDLKTDKSDILSRAQAEWHFTVLSGKLYEMYKSELDEYKEKIDALSDYSEDVWSEMKSFWEKVQSQVRERNLFRDHAANLKERTNNLFDKLKVLRKEMKKEFDIKSNEISNSLNSRLDEIESKIESGLALKPVFSELKEIQNTFFKANVNRKDKDSIWNRMDSLFKMVKQKQYGDKSSKDHKGGSRVQSRLDGLLKAIQRMQNSIAFDKKDVEFQNSKISNSEGQLEQQIRQAKLVMIQERLNSKQAKFDDMLKTKSVLLAVIEKEKVKQEKVRINQEKKKVEEAVKQKIADKIKTNKDELIDQEDKLMQAAKEIKSAKTKRKPKVVSPEKSNSNDDLDESIIDTIVNKFEQTVEDVKDTVSAIIDVAENKLDEAIKGFTEEE